MTQRQLAEVLHNATEFVLNLVDQVGRASGIDRLGHESTQLHSTEGDSLSEDHAETGQPHSVIRIKSFEQDEAHSSNEEGITVLDFGDEDDDGPIDLTSDALLDFEDDDEEETVAQDGQMLLELVDDDERMTPLSLRPTRDELGENMAREMLLDASGGSSDDDPMDRTRPPEGTLHPEPDA